MNATSAVPSGVPRRLIIAITGATGAIYGVRMLETLRRLGGVETHLLISAAGWLNIQHELQLSKEDLHARADVVHSVRDVGATIASGSFATDGMIVAPCSMKTLAEIASGMSSSLISRAADVTLKERRPLVLLARETPYTLAHLRNMIAVTEMGAIVAPPVPAFYARPASLDQMIDHTLGRVLDLFGLEAGTVKRWREVEAPAPHIA